ncbi:MAG: hypothetical protein IKK24_07275 [Clostridia bacterium]|nr:hypothetical protein [Clostridia bacterium]
MPNGNDSGIITSAENIDVATKNYENIVNSTQSPVINSIASSQYVLRLIENGVTEENAIAQTESINESLQNSNDNGIISDSENNLRSENDGSTDTELLERGAVSTTDRGGNSLRQQGRNSEKLRSLLGNVASEQGTNNSGIRAGESTWMGEQRESQSETKGNNRTGLSEGFYRGLSRINAKNKDTANRTISEKTLKRLNDSIFKTEEGIIISLFHWTPFKFDEFKKGDIGFHAGTMQSAIDHMGHSEDYKNEFFGYLKEIYCCAKNPVFMQDFTGIWIPYDAKQLVEDGYITQEEYDSLENLEGFNDIRNSRIDSEAAIALRKILASYGYDVILYKNAHEDKGSISAIILNAEDIITVAENGVLKEGCGVTENVSNSPHLQSSAKEGARGFRDSSDKEIYRDLTQQESLEALNGERKNAKQRHITDVAAKLDSSLRIVWVDKNSDKLNGKNGKYVREINTIYLAKDMSLPEMYVEVFKHEFVHRLESKGAYKAFKDYLINKSVAFEQYVRSQLKIINGEVFNGSREEAIKALTGHYYNTFKNDKTLGKPIRDRFTLEGAEREIVADFGGEVLFKGKENRADIAQALADADMLSIGSIESNLDALEELAKTDRNLFQKLWDVIKDFISSLKTVAQNKRLVEDLEYIEQRLARVYDSRDTKKAASESGGVQYKINDGFYTQLEKWDGETTGFSFVLGSTSNALKIAGIPQKQIRWDATKIKTLLKKHNGMTIDVIKQIPELLENPVVIIDSKQDSNSKIIMGDLKDKNNKIVTVVLLLTPTSEKGNQLDILKISSAQGRGHIESLFKKEDGTAVAVRYKDEKRIQDWLNVNRLQLPLHSPNMDSSNKIPQKEDSVKNNISTESKNYSEDGPFSSGSPMQIARENLKKYENGELTREQYLEENERLWGEAIEKYGSIPEGENAQAPIQTPNNNKKVIPNHKIRNDFLNYILNNNSL